MLSPSRVPGRIGDVGSNVDRRVVRPVLAAVEIHGALMTVSDPGSWEALHRSTTATGACCSCHTLM